MGLIAAGLFTFGGAGAQVLTGPLVVAQMQDWPGAKPASAAPSHAAPPPVISNDKSPHGANPLWATPVASFTATRERPLFSPSRRPPAPAAVVKVAAPPPPPPKPTEPEKPHLSLVGTIMGNSGQRIGLFVNAADKSPLRLKIGENDKGWVLRDVQPRQVVLEKRQQNAVLKLVRLEPNKVAAVPSAPPSKEAPPSNDKAPVDEVASTTSLAVNSPNSSTIIIPKQSNDPLPPGEFTFLSPAVAHEPQVNPFQKARLP